MISNTLAHLALRNLALSLAVATTGSTSLSATATGYARTAGSFVTDGFKVGLDLTGAGFAVAGNNGAHVITAVTALTISCAGTAVDAVAAGRTLSVGLPTMQALTNVDFTPVTGRPYVEESYTPGPAGQVTLGPLGQVELFPMYTLNLYGISNTGISGLMATVDALLLLFAPRTTLVLSSGDVVRVRTQPAPYASPVMQASPGWAMCAVTIPCWVRTANAI